MNLFGLPTESLKLIDTTDTIHKTYTVKIILQMKRGLRIAIMSQ